MESVKEEGAAHTVTTNSLSISLCSSLISGILVSRKQQVVRRYRIGQKGRKKQKKRPRFHDVYQALWGCPAFRERLGNASLHTSRWRPLKTSSWRNSWRFRRTRPRSVVAVFGVNMLINKRYYCRFFDFLIQKDLRDTVQLFRWCTRPLQISKC